MVSVTYLVFAAAFLLQAAAEQGELFQSLVLRGTIENLT